jgi:hypothetical protein
MSTMDATIRAFCAQQREWLELELQEEQQEETKAASSSGSDKQAEQRSQHVLHQLEAADVSVGLYGRTVVRLMTTTSSSTDNDNSLLPAHRFTTGNEVEIRSKATNTDNRHPTGVVSEVTESSISVVLSPSKKRNQTGKKGDNDKDDDDEHGDDDIFGSPPLSLLPKSSVEVHRKLIAALNELETKGVNHSKCGRIVQALFEATETTETTNKPSSMIQQPINENLDDSQMEAISFALTSNVPVSLIHGPVSIITTVLHIMT